ncbi:hypothetical protein ACQKFS_15680 [Pseudomonas guineae]|uniref:hypothetical protein n=1 Tax=Pseudomonas guineae TaxID=425504 RepID=UPI003D00F330
MSKFRKPDWCIALLSLLTTIIICFFFMGFSGLISCYSSPLTCSELDGLQKLAKLYDEKLRSDFFSGFLAVGAFLLSLKTFIVMTMKTTVYDTEKYREIWEGQKKLDARIGGKYSGLKQLNDCMFNSILFSLAAAVAQVTIGLVGGTLFTLVSVYLCIISVAYLGYCLFLVKQNLDAIIPDE